MMISTARTSAIRAKQVIGADVKDRHGRKIGVIEDIILDNHSNHIIFAVLSFGAFLGIGETYPPLPWASLHYDERDDGFVVDVTVEQLRAAPTGSIDELTNDAAAFVNRSGRPTRYRESRQQREPRSESTVL